MQSLRNYILKLIYVRKPEWIVYFGHHHKYGILLRNLVKKLERRLNYLTVQKEIPPKDLLLYRETYKFYVEKKKKYMIISMISYPCGG